MMGSPVYKDKDGNVRIVPCGMMTPVDTTLSKVGQAADAKKTGDEIADLK